MIANFLNFSTKFTQSVDGDFWMWVSKIDEISQIQRFWCSEFVIISDFVFNTHLEGPFGDQLTFFLDRSHCISKAILLQILFGLNFFIGLFIFRIHFLNLIFFLFFFFLFSFYLYIFQHKFGITCELFIIVIIHDGLIEFVKFGERLEIEIGCTDLLMESVTHRRRFSSGKHNGP